MVAVEFEVRIDQPAMLYGPTSVDEDRAGERCEKPHPGRICETACDHSKGFGLLLEQGSLHPPLGENSKLGHQMLFQELASEPHASLRTRAISVPLVAIGGLFEIRKDKGLVERAEFSFRFVRDEVLQSRSLCSPNRSGGSSGANEGKNHEKFHAVEVAFEAERVNDR